jgi:hypothetical protein
MLLIFFFLCLGLIGLYGYWQANALQNQADNLRQQQQNLATQVTQLEKQYPERKPSVLLQEKIKRTEQSVLGQRQALDYFSKQDPERNVSILASLEGLARYPQKGIWLRQVSLLNAGQEIQIAGSALKAELVPEYLQLLGVKNIFGGQVFSRLKLKRLKEQRGQVDFELDSARGGVQ